MDRRAFLKTFASAGSLAAAGGFPAPALSQGAAAKTLRFVPQANLANFDPVWGTQYVVRNASQLVWDTLYGLDSKLQPKRQMVESEESSSDGLTWTFKLRDGLKFHDGEKVLAKDVVASITRWTNRDSMGLMLKAIQKELTAVDDRTVKWVLSKPYPKVTYALAKVGTPCCFIMPEPRPTPSSKSTSTSARARCGSCVATGSPVRSPPSRNSRTMCRGTSPASGGRAARSCTSIASSG